MCMQTTYFPKSSLKKWFNQVINSLFIPVQNLPSAPQRETYCQDVFVEINYYNFELLGLHPKALA